MTEFFDVLDENGNKTGQTKPRTEVHKDGDWHKAVHVWIVNEKNEVLLQKRSPNKDSNPNMWDISSAGHLSAGDESVPSAIRELKEELGVDIRPAQLVLIGTRKKASRYTSSFINNEFNDVYLLRLSLNLKELKLQEEEVSAVKYVSLQDFREMIINKDPTLLRHEDEFAMLFKALGTKL